VIVAFGNKRFDSNTLAPRHHRTYDNMEPFWNQLFLGVSM
jgi:hypothetical protein